MSLIRQLIFTVTLALAMAAGSAQALEMTKQQRAEQRRFAYNNSLFVLHHEVGHLLFHQLDLPILGREEDAADNYASWALLSNGTSESEQVLDDAARGWLLSGVAYDSGGDESDFAAAHSLDKQRAYQIVCLAIGMDQNVFRPIANEYRIARDRQESCAWDYDMVNRSFSKLLEGEGSKKGLGTEVVVTYHHVGGRLKAAADAFRSSGVFDEVADSLRTRYRLRETVQFNAKRCGEANAFYDPETVEVIFCYELMQDYMDLYADDLAQEIANSPAGKQKIR